MLAPAEVDIDQQQIADMQKDLDEANKMALPDEDDF